MRAASSPLTSPIGDYKARLRDPLFASRQQGSRGSVLKHFKPNGLRHHLNQVALDTGLALTVRGAARVGRDEVNWRRRYGVSVQPIPTHS